MRVSKRFKECLFKYSRCRNLWTIFFALLVGLIVVYYWNNRRTSEKTGVDRVRVGDHGVFKGKEFKEDHVFDPKLSQALTAFFKSEGNTTSILELGAGRGDYANMFKSEGLFVSCYDGNPDTQYVSDGRCGIIDLSKPIDFVKHDWVLSLEVGEHVPKEFEEIFISNIDKGNKKGIIISWAIEGQGGLAHVNNRNNSYIREQFNKLDYTSDFESEILLRNATSVANWFKGSIMVFRRKFVQI